VTRRTRSVLVVLLAVGVVADDRKRSTWNDVEEWRSIATGDEANLPLLEQAVNLDGIPERLSTDSFIRWCDSWPFQATDVWLQREDESAT
jgi:hypothetical protein